MMGGRRGARRPGPTVDDEWLHTLQKATFTYFWQQTDPENGLIPDNTMAATSASIAGVGLSLATCAVGAERGFVTRAQALERSLRTLRFLWNGAQGTEGDATGYRGFFYHFLDVRTGLRASGCELSTMDTAILLAGVLAAGAYFDRDMAAERELRALAEQLYLRVDWRWARNGGATVTHGWTPERGFLPYRWEGFNEGLLVYVLGLGSPTHALPEQSYLAWMSTYRWKTLYGQQFLYGGPLFMHQLSHVWIDFREIQDAYMRPKGIDYFENSRRATYVQQAYAIRNPKGFAAYGEHLWGITASNGPGPAMRQVDGVPRRFLGYRARGVPYGPDDGTIAPWAIVASLPFAPEIVLPTLQHCMDLYPTTLREHGLVCSINPTFRETGSSGYRGTSRGRRGGWVSHTHFALDQGPVVLMIENYRSGMLWRLMRRCLFVVRGLRRAGFNSGWLDDSATRLC